MRAQPDQKFTTVTAEALERITAGPAIKPQSETRTETLNRLSDAPLVSAKVLSSSARAVEGLLIMLAGFALAHFNPGYEDLVMTLFYVPMIIGAGVLFPFVAHAFGHYSIQSLLRPVEQIARLASIWTVLFAAMAVAVFLLKSGESYSRFWLASWYLTGLSLIIVARIVTVPKLGNVDDLIEFARQDPHRSAPGLAAGHRRTARPANAASKLWVLPVDIRLSRAYAASSASARAPIPTSATCRCSTSSTSRSPTGTSC
jgi:hypothetical protein